MEIPLKIHPEIMHAIHLLSDNKIGNKTEALSIIKNVVSNYDITCYPNYSTGLAGIGCGIQYLICSGLLEVKADEVLSEFDRHLFHVTCFHLHTDFSQATGLMGIASYFFARLEDTNNEELSTVTNKTTLLSILDILLAKYHINGYSSFDRVTPSPLSLYERLDIEIFIQKFVSCNICKELAFKLQKKIKLDEFISLIPYNDFIDIEEDMDDVTIILPIRVDSEIRIQNIQTIIRLYTKLTNAHFIILEADKTQHIYLKENKQIKYLFQTDENLVFHHTHYRNELIKLAQTPIVVVWDSDILVPIKQLYEAVSKIRNNQIVLSYPYDGVCYTLPSDISNQIRHSLDLKSLTERNDFQKMFGQLTVGGIFVVNREKYMKVGMENEYFIGWGPEDVERLKRLTILDVPVSRVNGCIYHLYHPRKLNSGYINKSRMLLLKKELLRICQMDKSILLQEIKTWKWLD